MNDKIFLQWLHDRMIHVYGENENVDFLMKLQNIINNTPDYVLTPNMSDCYDEKANKVNLSVILNGYEWIVGRDNEVLALTAGDQHFEPTGIQLNLDYTDKALIDKDEAFDKAWQACNQSKEPTEKSQLKDALEAVFNEN